VSRVRMRRVTAIAFAMALGVGGSSAGCGGSGAQRPASDALGEMDRVRAAPGSQEGRELAPQAFAKAEGERAAAQKARDAGDDAGASLYADRAIAAYSHALVLARLSRATRELGDAQQAAGTANDQAKKLAAQHADIDREADALEKQVKVAREMLLPAPSGPVDAARRAARLVAARALAMQARLLCGSARLLASPVPAPGLSDAETELASVEKQLDGAAPKSGSASIDAAARVRASCLAALTKTRRATDGASPGAGDALLTELSAAGGWDPARDERGVVVTLRGAFQGASLTKDADAKLKELGRVAAAHPTFAIQVVVHDASAPSAAELTADAQRGDAAAKALVAGGAIATKVKTETAGARAPLVDPADAAHRARNARIEIVFVTPGS
jgi:outer membrane protein OmpA-like peptidoglycan-associated protein